MFTSRSAKVILLSSGQALTALVGIVSMVVLTRVFSKLELATYRQTLLAYSFAVPFVMLGLDQALYFFLPGEQRRPRALLVENLVLLALGGALLSLFILLGGNHLLARRLNNPALAPVLLLLAPYPLLMLPASALGACLMARNHPEQVAGFHVASRLVVLILVLLPALIWTTPAAAIAGTVLGAVLTTSAAIFLMFRACPSGPWAPEWGSMKAQLLFAVPLGLAALVGTLSLSLGQVLVSARCPPEVFAVYSVGAMEIPLIGMITGSITSVVLVDYARFHREGRTSEIVALIHRAMTKSALFLLPIMVLLLCLAPDLIGLLFGERYRASALPFRVLLLLLPVRTITFGAVLQATGKSHHILVASALTLVANATLGWMAIGWFGAVGIAWASVVSIYLICVPYLMRAIGSTLQVPLRHLFPWRELWQLLALTALAGGATWAFLMVLPDQHLLRLVLGTLVYGGLLLALALSTGIIQARTLLDTARLVREAASRIRPKPASPNPEDPW